MEHIAVPCRTTTMDFRQLQMNIEIAGCGYRPCRCINWHKNRTQIPYCCLLLPRFLATSDRSARSLNVPSFFDSKFKIPRL